MLAELPYSIADTRPPSTPFTKAARLSGADNEEALLESDELRTAMEQTTPLKRIGEPEDIAAAVLYVCSQAGSYITGALLDVNGGLDTPNLDFGLPDL